MNPRKNSPQIYIFEDPRAIIGLVNPREKREPQNIFEDPLEGRRAGETGAKYCGPYTLLYTRSPPLPPGVALGQGGSSPARVPGGRVSGLASRGFVVGLACLAPLVPPTLREPRVPQGCNITILTLHPPAGGTPA